MILGIGIDMVEVERVRRSIERWGDRWTRRICTRAEREFCDAARDPAPRYAARFAAKEAFYKAMPAQPEIFIPTRIEVYEENGRSVIRVHGNYKEILTGFEPLKIHLSLTHEPSMAAAVVIIEKE